MSQSINLYRQLLNHKLFNKSVNFGLKRIKLALSLLGNPERKLNNVINVLGESGKFTTLWALKSFIEANNQTVSTYISPSLQDIRERFYMGNRYLTYKEIKVDNRPDLREKLQNLSGSHTVPQIWIENVHIGGFTELDACENSGRLDRLLSK